MMHLAVLIVLLHSFVPHHHHQESAGTAECIALEKEQSHDLLDLLADVFHTDLGDDHLENWVKSNAQNWGYLAVDFDLSALTTPLASQSSARGDEEFNFPANERRAYIHFTESHSQRGPPVYILA